MEVAWILVALWIAFGASHMALSSQRWRPRLVARLGAAPFSALYSALALAIFVPLVWIYVTHRHSGPYLGTLAGVPGLRWVVLVGLGAAMALLVAGIVRPAPSSVAAGRDAAADPGGLFQVTRHPLLMAMGLFGLLHLCAVAVHASELAFFAGFPLFVAVGCLHQDRRKLASGDEAFRRFHAATPFLPFTRPAGVIEALRSQPLAIAVGVGLAVLLRWLHPAMFGA